MAMNIALGQLQKCAGPDTRITARSEITSSSPVTNPYFTGVWAATPSGDPSAIMWLISGGENASVTPTSLLSSALDPTDDTVTNDTLFLVGNQTVAIDPKAPTAVEKTRRIKLPKQDINAPTGGVSGLGSTDTPPRIGRYAWWIGDQGVKASLALPDRADEVTYAPWDTETQRRRIRQQIASMPNYFRMSTATTTLAKEGFDPFVVGAVLSKVHSHAQLGFITPTAGSMDKFLRGHYHDFTPVARSVLANTRIDAHAGLMRDLSLKPDELGTAFAAYADYTHYMERPGGTLADADVAYPQIENADSSRRRYQITSPTSSVSAADLPDLVFGVSPVLTEFMLQFKFERSSANRLTVKSRLYVGLWNPYTSALAPRATEGLAIEIVGLPAVTVRDDVTGSSVVVNLQTALPSTIKASGGEMRVLLPFGNGVTTTQGTQADRSSWLPGRIYGWTTATGDTPGADLKFYDKNISAQGWACPAVGLTGSSKRLSVSTSGSIAGLTLRLVSTAGTLATYTTPGFKALNIPGSASNGTSATPTWKFAFATRLKQPIMGDSNRTWLKTFDPRNHKLPAEFLGGFDPNQDITPLDPSVYMDASAPNTVFPDYLLYRIQGTASNALSMSGYNDVPLFELPRSPLLSVGMLQHVQVKDSRPFSIGNSWGGQANAIFDRFFFSGLQAAATEEAAKTPDLAAGQPLPNWNLQPVAPVAIAKVRAAAGLSSQHLLQAGGFNINSTSVAAWRAVLSGLRLHQAFASANIENSSGQAFGTQLASTALVTESFDRDATLGTGTAAPTFSRFSHSAQETYFWRPVSGSGSTNKRAFSTHAFRLGVRGSGDSSATAPVDPSITAQRLTTDQVESLAVEIVRLLKARAEIAGPFRTLEEFLGPQSEAGTPSLIEAAIAATTINPDEIKPVDNVALSAGVYGAGFSSLTLTQADILTALAPYLRVRSDTFTIRCYGEAINPITAETTGKAWLEATVQRFPETVDAGDNIETPSGAFGRRFKIISFRWLSPSDI